MILELNKHGVNAKIKAHILSDEEMRAAGFTDYCKDRWYYFRTLSYDISFSVTIPKDGSDIRIDVLDESFGQPYDFQYLLESNKEHQFPKMIKNKVEKQMEYLQGLGVLSGHVEGEYI